MERHEHDDTLTNTAALNLVCESMLSCLHIFQSRPIKGCLFPLFSCSSSSADIPMGGNCYFLSQ